MEIINRICWNITNKCNDGCQFCFRQKNSNELPYQMQKKVIDILVNLGINHITFSGGEALLCKSIFKIIDYAYQKGFSVNLITNGKLLNRENVSRISGKVQIISLPIDVCDNEMIEDVNNIGRSNGHNDIIEKQLALLESFPDISIKINTVITKLNFNELIPIYYKFIHNNPQIKIWNLFEFTDLRGSSIDNKEKFSLSPKLFKEIKESFLNYKKNGLFRNDLSIRIKSKETICGSYLVLSPNGDFVLKQGVEEEKIIGNIFDRNIRCLLNNINFDLIRYTKRLKNKALIIV